MKIRDPRAARRWIWAANIAKGIISVVLLVLLLGILYHWGECILRPQDETANHAGRYPPAWQPGAVFRSYRPAVGLPTAGTEKKKCSA